MPGYHKQGSTALLFLCCWWLMRIGHREQVMIGWHNSHLPVIHFLNTLCRVLEVTEVQMLIPAVNQGKHPKWITSPSVTPSPVGLDSNTFTVSFRCSVWTSYPLGFYSWRGQACEQEGCWSRHRWPVSGAGPGFGPVPGSEGMKAWLVTQTSSHHPSNIPLHGPLLSHWPWTYHQDPSVST